MDAREWRFCTALEGGREIEGGGDITDAILIGKFAANATLLRLFVGDCHHPLEAMLRGRKEGGGENELSIRQNGARGFSCSIQRQTLPTNARSTSVR